MCQRLPVHRRPFAVLPWAVIAWVFVLYGLSSAPRAAATVPWILLTWSGWGYAWMLLYLTVAAAHSCWQAAPCRKHTTAANTGLQACDSRLLAVCHATKSVCTVLSVGYWAVLGPLTYYAASQAWTVVNHGRGAYTSYGWYQFLLDWVLHGLPLAFGLFYGPGLVHGYQSPPVTCCKAIGRVLLFPATYIVFCILYWLVTDALPYTPEYCLAPRAAILVLAIWTPFFMLSASIRACLYRRRATLLREREARRGGASVQQDAKASLLLSGGAGTAVHQEEEGEAPSQGSQLATKQAAKGCSWVRVVVATIVILAAVAAVVAGLRAAVTARYGLHDVTISGVQVPRFAVWNQAMNKSWVSGQDGGASLMLNEHQAVWLFGDTGTTNGWLVSNTAALVTLGPGNGSVASRVSFQYLENGGGHATAVLPFNKSEDGQHWALWPSVGVTVGDTAYAFFELVPRASTMFDTSFFGIAAAQGASMNFHRVVQPGSGVLPFLPYGAVTYQPGAGGGSNVDGGASYNDTYLYLYYLQRPTLASSNVYLARVRAADLLRGGFEYWTGDGFDAALPMSQSPPVALGAVAQVSVSWNKFLGRYVMYSAGLLGHWHSIYVRSAAKPWGPFDAPRLAFRQHVATGNGLFNVKEVFYCPYIHPELSTNDDRDVYLTHSGMQDGINRLINIHFE